MFHSIGWGLSVKPTVELLNKLLFITFKIRCEHVHKVILDLMTLAGNTNKDRVREDTIVDVVDISLSMENCCFNGVEATSKPTEINVIFLVQPHITGGNFAILLGGI